MLTIQLIKHFLQKTSPQANTPAVMFLVDRIYSVLVNFSIRSTAIFMFSSEFA